MSDSNEEDEYVFGVPRVITALWMRGHIEQLQLDADAAELKFTTYMAAHSGVALDNTDAYHTAWRLRERK